MIYERWSIKGFQNIWERIVLGLTAAIIIMIYKRFSKISEDRLYWDSSPRSQHQKSFKIFPPCLQRHSLLQNNQLDLMLDHYNLYIKFIRKIYILNLYQEFTFKNSTTPSAVEIQVILIWNYCTPPWTSYWWCDDDTQKKNFFVMMISAMW